MDDALRKRLDAIIILLVAIAVLLAVLVVALVGTGAIVMVALAGFVVGIFALAAWALYTDWKAE